MPNNNDDRKLLLYISISIVLHLLVIYFLPIGFLHGSAQSESELNDYGYVQMVDYQPSPIETENAVEEAELTEDPDEEELEEIEEVEEPEKEPEIVEEEIEEIEAAEESEPKPEVIEEPEPASEPEPEVKKPEEEVIASKESESEVEVVQQEISESESESESENEAVEENIDSAAVQEEESAPPPPPPPTSGDLIGLIEPPTFPKDLVGSRSEGTVSLMVRISPGGNVEDIEIVESSGYDSMDRVAQLTLEHGWKFKEYQQAYKIPVSVRYYIDQSDNSQVEVDIGQVDFIAGGE
ncbi:energy transducer TonB [Halanaerobium congolense]|jgi:protein TonB|uniref:Outer membrane transport energization protein TonB n=1 Tax=Halanaerobium congolense TaxID=54121 RepID=A0A4R7EGD5_9FIRM|nr:energy transducer TonB [Halanaerobium congolense]TDS33745.1 outer membrane transport energization protein TonB [Halanaerobium congolense]SDK38910.1 outer membrane transport energization protein TonB [Halanaerobium congolense]SDM03598.1 outer membrane transport energization protein TonB [Halanaerobium congolense]